MRSHNIVIPKLVYTKKIQKAPLVSNDFVSTVNILKTERGDPFVTLKNSPRNVISGIRYIRNSLYPVCIKSDMGCVVEGDSFTAQM